MRKFYGRYVCGIWHSRRYGHIIFWNALLEAQNSDRRHEGLIENAERRHEKLTFELRTQSETLNFLKGKLDKN